MNPLVEYEATFTDGTSFSLSQTQAVERVLCDQSVQQYCGFDGKDVTDNLQYDILAIFHPHGRRQVRGFPQCDTLLLEGSGRGIHAPHRPRPQSVTKGHAMSFGETQITVIGRLTKDPELRTTGNGGDDKPDHRLECRRIPVRGDEGHRPRYAHQPQVDR